MHAHTRQPIFRFIRPSELPGLTGRGLRQLQRMSAAGEFPPFYRQSHRVSVCYGEEVEGWMLWQRDQDAGQGKGRSWRDYVPKIDGAS